MLERLDRQLWAGEGFLPHGLAGGEHDAVQPVLLTTAAEAPNRPACVMSVGGAEVGAEEVTALERVCILFDGSDAASLDTRARPVAATDRSGGCGAVLGRGWRALGQEGRERRVERLTRGSAAGVARNIRKRKRLYSWALARKANVGITSVSRRYCVGIPAVKRRPERAPFINPNNA